MFIWDNNIAPLLIGEWGGFLTQPNVKWMGIMCDLIEQKGLSHTFWCLNPNSGDTGGLLQNDWSTWENDKYEFIKRTLWQTSGGKFIGLSDTVPLGKNGVTRADA
uniref:Glycoside hydrolase family 5 n=1 Tax=Coptotermes formosanus TaxID=36987 RepID=R4UV98_COPFO|nr:glycoside hydrolase family 5 [Coptotermes formosanus]